VQLRSSAKRDNANAHPQARISAMVYAWIHKAMPRIVALVIAPASPRSFAKRDNANARRVVVNARMNASIYKTIPITAEVAASFAPRLASARKEAVASAPSG
jgi:hypothetical protein